MDLVASLRGAKVSDSLSILEEDYFLGEGKFSYVLAAWNDIVEEVIALKILKEEYNNKSKLFIREARNAMKLSSPFIVPVYLPGYFKFKGSKIFYLPMKKMDKTLDSIIEEIDVETALVFTHQILNALLYAKKKRILHGDLHWRNIFVEEAPEMDRVKKKVMISDWGLALVLGSEEREEDGSYFKLSGSYTSDILLLSSGSVKNVFVPPETLKKKYYDEKSQIFQVGGLLACMVLRELEMSVEDYYNEGGWNIDEDVAKIIERSYVADRRRRYNSMEAMIKDIEPLLGGDSSYSKIKAKYKQLEQEKDELIEKLREERRRRKEIEQREKELRRRKSKRTSEATSSGGITSYEVEKAERELDKCLSELERSLREEEERLKEEEERRKREEEERRRKEENERRKREEARREVVNLAEEVYDYIKESVNKVVDLSDKIEDTYREYKDDISSLRGDDVNTNEDGVYEMGGEEIYDFFSFLFGGPRISWPAVIDNLKSCIMDHVAKISISASKLSMNLYKKLTNFYSNHNPYSQYIFRNKNMLNGKTFGDFKKDLKEIVETAYDEFSNFDKGLENMRTCLRRDLGTIEDSEGEMRSRDLLNRLENKPALRHKIANLTKCTTSIYTISEEGSEDLKEIINTIEAYKNKL